MRWIKEENINNISTGAAVLGTGGGGDPYIGKLMALAAIRDFGPVKVISLDELTEDDFIIPVSSMGSPSVLVEKIPSFEQLKIPLTEFENAIDKKATVVMPIEIGGVNSLIPVAVAAINNIPILDGDSMGRAFPESQMCTFHLDNIHPEYVVVADEKGNVVTVKPIDGEWSEKISRKITISMGGSSLICDYGVTSSQAKESVIPGTLSLAEEIGAILNNKNTTEEHPIKRMLMKMNGYQLFKGKVTRVERRIQDGFTRGTANFEGVDDNQNSTCRIHFQNEHLLAEINNKAVAITPDLIAVLDEETGLPITTEGLKYGARTIVVAFPAHEKWRTKRGLDTAGPDYFKYDYTYVPLEFLQGEDKNDSYGN